MADKKRFFIKPQGLMVLTGIIVILALITINIFFKSPKVISKPRLPKGNLTQFFENLMIREGGLYTLVGTKPITEFDIESSYKHTEENIRESYEELKAFLKKADKEKNLPEDERKAFNLYNLTLPSFAEYKEEWDKQRDFLGPKELWEEWNKSSRELDPKFRLFSKMFGEVEAGFFVNIPNLVYTLHHYKKDFCERIYMEFDPNEVVFQIGDETSIFWKKVFQDHFLLGLILGYGERSSYLFDWGEKHLKSIKNDRKHFFYVEDRQVINLMGKPSLEVPDLLWPVFFHFGITDLMRLYYELEREKIIEYFQEKNFTETTLKILTGH